MLAGVCEVFGEGCVGCAVGLLGVPQVCEEGVGFSVVDWVDVWFVVGEVAGEPDGCAEQVGDCCSVRLLSVVPSTGFFFYACGVDDPEKIREDYSGYRAGREYAEEGAACEEEGDGEGEEGESDKVDSGALVFQVCFTAVPFFFLAAEAEGGGDVFGEGRVGADASGVSHSGSLNGRVCSFRILVFGWVVNFFSTKMLRRGGAFRCRDCSLRGVLSVWCVCFTG